ncbi:hypothetical protein PHMEG_0005891 [Phytophthora megakarya]|uniref:Uncharacterized protein n=1 Tax=Phytophthora megakarya TaxID=4795 RepID=A0A225WQ20_9STRA|nr:hypothetical protein PHMEG_0005891 [Phytophthora megakarya]
MNASELPPHHPPVQVAAYVHRMELSSRCTGESQASQSAMDLTNIMSDKTTLQHLVRDLFRPFETLHVDQIMALHVEGINTPSGNGEFLANGKNAHRFTTAIAGAMAGANQLAYGEVSALKKTKKRNKSTAKLTIRASKCNRIVTVDCGDGEFSVEFKRKAITETRVLLVIDWVSEVESVFAARDALTRLGCDVVGASFVLATNASILRSLKSAQMSFSCSWSPSHGAKLNTSVPSYSNGSTCCSCHQSDASNGQTSRKRQHNDIDSDPSVKVLLRYRTAEYQV